MDHVGNTLLEQQVNTTLFEIFGRRVAQDSDGDWPIRVGERAVYIRPQLQPIPHVLLFTRAAQRVAHECMSELNDLNVSAAWAKFVLSPSGDVFVIQRVTREAISASSVTQAIESVSTCADDAGAMLAAVYGTSAAST